MPRSVILGGKRYIQRHAYKPKPHSYPGPISPYKSLQAQRYAWLKTARPEQIVNHGRYPGKLLHLFMTGRGWGKTRTCGEEVVDFVRREWKQEIRGALVGPTFTDARDTMVEGTSGLLSFLPPSALRNFSVEDSWNRSLGELYFSNGSKFKVFTSERPRQLRGPQHHVAWVEEVAQWHDAHKGDTEDTTWSNLLFGLRLGSNPYIVGGTTPRNVKLVKELVNDPRTVLQTGTTRDNLLNLSDIFARTVIGKYYGTRLGQQELLGLLLQDVEGALWRTAWIDKGRVFELPSTLRRIVISVDVATTKKESSNSTGIIAIGADQRKHCYVLGDMSDKMTPNQMANKVIFLYDNLKADAVVYESNNGGDYIPTVIHNACKSQGRRFIPCRPVHATRDKKTRAEPVAHEYELTPPTVHHVDYLPELEDQLVTWDPLIDNESPDRLDALVWGVTYLQKYSGGLRA